MSSLYVINLKGEKEPFSLQKVYKSARAVGASKELAKEIAKVIEQKAYPGIKTSEIFKQVKKLLKKEIPKAALKFNLKEGMRKLGPTGFPFEKYIGAIFTSRGFKVKLNQRIPGYCLLHEIDFVAQKSNLFYIGECKYRNLAGDKVHSKDALSNYARFLDIKNGYFFDKNDKKNFEIRSLLVTNTKFTDNAMRYSKCVGVELLGWNYPRKRGLEYIIETQKLYPITILPSLKRYLAEVFALKGLMLVQDLLEKDIKKLAKKTKISKKQLESLIKEAKILLE